MHVNKLSDEKEKYLERNKSTETYSRRNRKYDKHFTDRDWINMLEIPKHTLRMGNSLGGFTKHSVQFMAMINYSER